MFSKKRIFLTVAAVLMSTPALAQSVEPLALDQLGEVRAGEAPQLNVATRQNLDALSSGNRISADNVTSGQVNFSNGAFSGFNGIGNVVVNTGNNNAIQGSLSVTVVGLQ